MHLSKGGRAKRDRKRGSTERKEIAIERNRERYSGFKRDSDRGKDTQLFNNLLQIVIEIDSVARKQMKMGTDRTERNEIKIETERERRQRIRMRWIE